MMSSSKDLSDYMIRKAMDAGITNHRELAVFMGQASAETGNFRNLEESMNYDGAGLRRTFGNYWSVEEADRIAKGGPESVGNAIYGGRLGNNNQNDGYDFRGRGYVHLTGRENYETTGRALNIDLKNNPDMAADPEVAAKIAIHYWNTRVRSANAETDVLAATQAINGGTNGLDDRISATAEWEQKFANGYLKALSTNPPPINGLRDGILGPNDLGKDVILLQKTLNKAIDAGLTPDGDYGPATEKAVRAFQQSNGIAVTGIAGPETLKKLGVDFPQQPTQLPQSAAPTMPPPSAPQSPPGDTPGAPSVNAGRVVPPTGFGTWPVPGNYEPNPPTIGDPRYDTGRGGKSDGHAGIDIKANVGDPVVAFKAGVVDPIGGISFDRNGGWCLQIQHDDGTYTMYQHLKEEPKLALGQRVEEGQKIAEVGESGNARGVPQLHFEVREGDGGFNTDVNPSKYLQQKSAFGPQVKELQELLVKQGYDAGPANGVFGEQTKTAVMAWQKTNGLDQTGAVDGNALEAIRHPEKYRAAPTQAEPSPQQTQPSQTQSPTSVPTAPAPSPQPSTQPGDKQSYGVDVRSVDAKIAELPLNQETRELLHKTNAVVNTLPPNTFDSPDQQLRASAAVLADRLSADKGIPQSMLLGTKGGGSLFAFESKDPSKDPSLGFSTPSPMDLNELKNRPLNESLQRIVEKASPELQVAQSIQSNALQSNPTHTNPEIEKAQDQKPRAMAV
jgi:putative chitinase